MVALRVARSLGRSETRTVLSAGRSTAIACTALVLSGAALAPGLAAQQDQGKEIFDRLCVMCHTIGGGTLIGPDLRGAGERHSEDWLIRFIQHSQQMVNEGDSMAVALFEEYQRVPMPDQALTDDEVRAVIAYADAAETAGPAPLEPATPAQVQLGQDLFQGTARFANGGPTCNSCHDITHDEVTGGGILAIELTKAFSRLGGPGVRAIIGTPPFPVMQQAYTDRPLTDDEVVALVGFLEQADAEQSVHQPGNYGLQLIGAGVLGAAVLLGLYSLAWRGRRRGSVNHEIFDRQIKSV